MEIAVFVEPVAGNGFRARLGEPFGWTAEGSTPEEALARVEEQVKKSQAAGGRIMSIQVPGAEHPLAKFAGMFENDPHFDEVVKIMEERRRQDDEDPDVL